MRRTETHNHVYVQICTIPVNVHVLFYMHTAICPAGSRASDVAGQKQKSDKGPSIGRMQ